ncbi:mannose-1-phosphate guanylyltransferase [Salinigranum marinum]|uniref:mannose-1-phosphate guanylyltransferase n=1 Tax=Salinigranum marinum TaxID=1515595 RepID=UPI002989B747|nr:sugar phosphate nucleotidyltransferase [Salinigranum marinum]
MTEATGTPPLVALVLAGGTGSRLYPASRSTRPKQFLPLLGETTLLERTVARADFADHVVVSTRPGLEADVSELVPDVDEVVVEPAGKDTGPALAYATHRIEAQYGDDVVVLSLPSDHHVGSREAFAATMRRGARVAHEEGRLVAFGVDPTRPDTGYGYIEPGTDRGAFSELAAFHEKPDAETAERYVAEGYLWNAGTFAWTPRAFREAARDSPLAPLVDALDEGRVEEGFAAVEPTSIDYAVMERVDDAAVVALDVPWDDLGSWDAMARLLPADEDGNVTQTGDAGGGDAEGALFVDSGENVVVSDGAHISLVGVDGLAVVAWDDRMLVVPKAEAQRVREVVSNLQDAGRF